MQWVSNKHGYKFVIYRIKIASIVNLEKKEFQMGFEPMTLSDLTRCSNHCATRDSKVNGVKLLTKLDFLTTEVPVAQRLEHPAKSGRVVGSDPI